MKTRYGVVVAAALLTALVLVQQSAVVPGHGRVTAGLQNALHGPWFVVTTRLIYRLLRRRLTVPSALAATAVVAPLLALATEAAQFASEHRQPGWADIGFDLLGAGAVLTVLLGRWRHWRPSVTWMTAAVLIIVSVSPALQAVAIQAHRNAIFPRLVDVAVPWQGGLLAREAATRIVTAPSEWPGAPQRVLEVTLTDTEWPGIHLPEPVPDWRAFEALEVDVFVTGADEPLPLSVSIRLRGAPTDHVYRTLHLAAGAHRLRLPLRELFDPEQAQVTRVVIYATRRHAGRVFLLGRVVLVAESPTMATHPAARYAGAPHRG